MYDLDKPDEETVIVCDDWKKLAQTNLSKINIWDSSSNDDDDKKHPV